MLRAGTETGSLTNHLMSRSTYPEPQRGMGATILCWTDRHAATITHVTPKTITVARDIATRTDTYHDHGDVPLDKSQGWFPFGVACAKTILTSA